MQGERAEDIVGETGLCRAWPALFQAVSDGESSRARCHIISNQIPVSTDSAKPDQASAGSPFASANIGCVRHRFYSSALSARRAGKSTHAPHASRYSHRFEHIPPRGLGMCRKASRNVSASLANLRVPVCHLESYSCQERAVAHGERRTHVIAQ